MKWKTTTSITISIEPPQSSTLSFMLFNLYAVENQQMKNDVCERVQFPDNVELIIKVCSCQNVESSQYNTKDIK